MKAGAASHGGSVPEVQMPQSGQIKRRLTFRDPRPQRVEGAPWPLLVVDDDPQVHAMTRVLLRDFEFQGRPFELLSAHSAAEARDILRQRQDVPVVLLDVVMESDEAGLELARYVREELDNKSIRIILRTGQPGEAPERRVMLDYDINDYRTKTELTAQRLFTAVVSALRSWSQIAAVEGLNATLEAREAARAAELEETRAFAESLLEMLPSPVWYKDGHGRFRLYNRAFREFFALDPACWPDSAEPGHLPDRLPAEEPETDAALLAGRAERLDYETSLADQSGMPRALMVSKTLMRLPDGTPHGLVAVATDITERKEMERELRRLATIDPLTAAFNRRHFLSAATQEMERAVRYGGPLSVMMLDVDHFKRINDRHGHAVGDEVLKAVVEVCRASLREIDVFARLGGEEFGVLLPATGLAGASGLAERLRCAVAATVLSKAGVELRVTVSVGVAERDGSEIAFDQLLGRADHALYRAKEDGRDRVVAAPSRG